MPVGLRILPTLARRSPVVVGAAVLLLSHSAAAAGIAIRYQAPEGCGTQDDFEAGVSRIVGRPISELHSAWASADVSIEPSADGFRLRVRVVSDHTSPRERNLAVTSCREALEAAELIVATNLSAPPPEPEPEPASKPKPEPANARPRANGPRLTIEDRPTKPGAQGAQQADPTQLRAGAPPHVLLGARFGLEPLLAPAPVALGWGMLGLEVQRIRLELTAGASSHSSKAVAGGGAVVHSWLAAGLVGCYSGPGSVGAAFQLWLCVGAEGGRFRATGESGMNLLNAHRDDSFWSAALVQGELLARLARGWSLAIGAQGVAALRSVQVTESNPQTGETIKLYSTPWVSVRPWLGLDWRF